MSLDHFLAIVKQNTRQHSKSTDGAASGGGVGFCRRFSYRRRSLSVAQSPRWTSARCLPVPCRQTRRVCPRRNALRRRAIWPNFSRWYQPPYFLAMATSAKRKQEETHLKMLREMTSLPANRKCFDCDQRGPTYVNMTVGSFVCTTCSGILWVSPFGFRALFVVYSNRRGATRSSCRHEAPGRSDTVSSLASGKDWTGNAAAPSGSAGGPLGFMVLQEADWLVLQPPFSMTRCPDLCVGSLFDVWLTLPRCSRLTSITLLWTGW